MKPSIRTFLLINLLLSATIITSIAIIANLFLAHKDMQSQLDRQLITTTTHIQSFFSILPNKNNLKRIQQYINDVHGDNVKLYQIERDLTKKQALSNCHQPSLEFQIWNAQGKLLLHTSCTPIKPFSDGTPKLSQVKINGHTWRVSTSYSPKTKLTVMAAERSGYRKLLENKLIQDSLLIMLITYPFLGLFIWFIVSRGLNPLKSVAEQVKHRAPSHLEPVDLKSVPHEIKPLISELNSLFDRLKRAFIRHERFTADAAHELKTPLAALNTHTQVALRADTDESRNETLLKVLGGVNRCTHVVQQLLTLSRTVPEAGINDICKVVLAKQAGEIAAMLAPEAIAKNVDLELLAPNSDANFLGNLTAIDILLRNLIDNAIRYTKENSFVKIDISETKGHVILKVTDNGPGIPEELRKRVFERFFRIIGNKTTGSGLGLSIVHQIVSLHNAQIELLAPKSRVGLEVKVTFPKDPFLKEN